MSSPPGPLRKREDKVTTGSISKPVVQPISTFDDDDDDDILTGLGLGDDDAGRHAPRTSTTSTPASPTPRTSTSKPLSTTTPRPRSPAGVLRQGRGEPAPPPDDKAIDAEEEETVQFGGYTPSVGVSSAAVGRRRAAKSSSLPARPFTSPAMRKTVRFSDVVESDVRPSTGAARENTQLSPPGGGEQAEEGGGVSVKNMGGDGSKGLPSYDGDLGNSELFETVSDQTKSSREKMRLEHPTFPWQKSQRSVSSISSVSNDVQTARVSRQLRETSRVKVTTIDHGDVAGSKEQERDGEGSEVRMALQRRVSDVELAMEREKTGRAQLEVGLGLGLVLGLGLGPRARARARITVLLAYF